MSYKWYTSSLSRNKCLRRAGWHFGRRTYFHQKCLIITDNIVLKGPVTSYGTSDLKVQNDRPDSLSCCFFFFFLTADKYWLWYHITTLTKPLKKNRHAKDYEAPLTNIGPPTETPASLSEALISNAYRIVLPSISFHVNFVMWGAF